MSEILEAVAAKNNVLREKLRRLLEGQSVKSAVERGWVTLEEETDALFSTEGSVNVSAVDGGNNRRSLLSFDVYVVKAVAEGFTIGKDGRVSRAFSKKIVDVDVMIPTEDSGDRIMLYRQVAEIKLLRYSQERSHISLADGSLESLIGRPIHIKLEHLTEEALETVGMSCEEAESVVRNSVDSRPYDSLVFKDVVERLVAREREKEAVRRTVMGVELLEKALGLKMVFESAVRNGLLVFVTKTGRSRRLFGLPVSDQYVLTVTTSKAGFYLDPEKSFEKPRDMVKGLPRLCGLRASFLELKYIRGLARLADRAPVLGVEVLYGAGNAPADPSSLFSRVVSFLRWLSPSGYPQPLQIADREAHIENADVEKALAALGITYVPTGREALDYD